MEAELRGAEAERTYTSYRQSLHWKRTAAMARRHAGWRCQRCRKITRGLGVYHLTYERIGREERNDLITLCQTCLTAARHGPPEARDRPDELKRAMNALDALAAEGRWDRDHWRPLLSPDASEARVAERAALADMDAAKERRSRALLAKAKNHPGIRRRKARCPKPPDI